MFVVLTNIIIYTNIFVGLRIEVNRRKYNEGWKPRKTYKQQHGDQGIKEICCRYEQMVHSVY